MNAAEQPASVARWWGEGARAERPKREQFRYHSYISAVADGVIVGLGVGGYALAIRWLATRNSPAG